MKTVNLILASLMVIGLVTGCGGFGGGSNSNLNSDGEENTNGSKESSTTEMLVYLKLAEGRQSDDQLKLLMDDVLWINGNDTETLKKYGIDPDDVCNDYAIVNEVEEWVPVIARPETTVEIILYSEEGDPEVEKVDLYLFRDHLSRWDDCMILAKITVSDGFALAIKEVYIP